MIQAADTSTQTRNRPRRQLIGIGSEAGCGAKVRRGTAWSGMTEFSVGGRFAAIRPADCALSVANCNAARELRPKTQLLPPRLRGGRGGVDPQASTPVEAPHPSLPEDGEGKEAAGTLR